jgi:hypothetical protein
MKRLFVLLLFCCSSASFSQEISFSEECDAVRVMRMDFLHDGTLTDDSVVKANLELMRPCGIDDFDVSFFGRMEMLSGILHNMTKEKQFDLLTYGDWLEDITKMKQTATYIKVREMTLASEKLAKTPARWSTWDHDLRLFNQLGASQNVIEKVDKYLRENPDPGKTYKEVLEEIKS